MNTTQSKTAIGTVLLSGNSLCPRTDTVVRIDSWQNLSRKEQRDVQTIEYWKTIPELAARSYVRYTTGGRRGSDVSAKETFEATRYYTREEMITAYAVK